MKVIHISINQAQRIIDNTHEDNLDDSAIKDLIQEIEQATGFRYDLMTRCWVGRIK